MPMTSYDVGLARLGCQAGYQPQALKGYRRRGHSDSDMAMTSYGTARLQAR